MDTPTCEKMTEFTDVIVWVVPGNVIIDTVVIAVVMYCEKAEIPSTLIYVEVESAMVVVGNAVSAAATDG